MWKYFKISKMQNKPPIPFQGNKKLWKNKFINIIKEMGEYDIYVDLFGGSGILSHWVKHIFPSSTVIYNDFDKYEDRCKQIKETNEILARCREVCKGLKRKQQIDEEKTKEIKKIFKEYSNPDLLTLNGQLHYIKRIDKNFKSVDDFFKEKLYNNLNENGYKETDKYFEGLQIYSKDWHELFEEITKENKDKKILFIMDPPYLYIDKSQYKNNYWLLNDSLKLFEIIAGYDSLLFSSDVSGFKELIDATNKYFKTNINYKYIYNRMNKINKPRKDYCLIFQREKQEENNEENNEEESEKEK